MHNAQVEMIGARQAFRAFCILHFALLASCTHTPPTTTLTPPQAFSAPAAVSALSQLKSDVLALTRAAGVQRGTWGIVVHSLDRDERLFELNPASLLVPASVAKLVSVASAVDAVGWDYRFETTLRTNG